MPEQQPPRNQKERTRRNRAEGQRPGEGRHPDRQHLAPADPVRKNPHRHRRNQPRQPGQARQHADQDDGGAQVLSVEREGRPQHPAHDVGQERDHADRDHLPAQHRPQGAPRPTHPHRPNPRRLPVHHPLSPYKAPALSPTRRQPCPPQSFSFVPLKAAALSPLSHRPRCEDRSRRRADRRTGSPARRSPRRRALLPARPGNHGFARPKPASGRSPAVKKPARR